MCSLEDLHFHRVIGVRPRCVQFQIGSPLIMSHRLIHCHCLTYKADFSPNLPPSIRAISIFLPRELDLMFSLTQTAPYGFGGE